MAKKGKRDTLTIRTVRSKEDRKRPSVFMRLKTDESFKGIALFEPDPELKNNPGYFEYYDHYDKQANQYVPCAGEKCAFCAANDNPSTRALTVWYFPEASDVKDQIKVFTMNYSTINDITDEAEEEDGLLGKSVRIKRLSDKGDYKVRVQSGKPLSKKELEKQLKRLAELFEDGLAGLVLKQLKTQIERLKAIDALEDDDDDEEETTTTSRRGKRVDDDDEEEEEDEEEDDDEEEDEEEDDDDETSSDDDDDEEEDDDEDDDDEAEEEAEEEEEAIVGGVYEVVKVDKDEEIFDLKGDDGKIKVWVGSDVEVDYDEVKKGVQVKIDASPDDEGDLIATSIELVKKGRSKGKTTGRRKARK